MTTNEPNVSREHILALAKKCGMVWGYTTTELVDAVIGFAYVVLNDKAVQEAFVLANPRPVLDTLTQEISAMKQHLVEARQALDINGGNMKVKELLEALAGADPEAEVILQKDAEGNGYSPLRGTDPDAVYVSTCTWSGDVYSMEWSADEACKSEDEWNAIKAMPRCVVLHPVN